MNQVEPSAVVVSRLIRLHLAVVGREKARAWLPPLAPFLISQPSTPCHELAPVPKIPAVRLGPSPAPSATSLALASIPPRSPDPQAPKTDTFDAHTYVRHAFPIYLYRDPAPSLSGNPCSPSPSLSLLPAYACVGEECAPRRRCTRCFSPQIHTPHHTCPANRLPRVLFLSSYSFALLPPMTPCRRYQEEDEDLPRLFLPLPIHPSKTYPPKPQNPRYD